MELLAQRTVEELGDALRRRNPINHNGNGNRSEAPAPFLHKILRIAPLVGISRIGDISGLTAYEFPVCQTTRPNVLHHGSLGQNTGAQGKGIDRVQARISSIMESVELYCAEPRSPRLVRGAFERLREQFFVLPPPSLFRRKGAPCPTVDEPLMWTEALHLPSYERILVPAECVYFYFTPGTYGTRSVFPMGTSGLASGASYLDATIHGLYELIERMYVAFGERDEARIDCLFEQEAALPTIADWRTTHGTDYELQLFTSQLEGQSNLPMVSAVLVGDEHAYVGHGCACSVDVAIERAVSEALQGFCTIISGSREDAGSPPDGTHPCRAGLAATLPRFRNLHVCDYRHQVQERAFADLKDELDFLLAWLDELGFADVCIANLARTGIDLPVVKVLIPGLPMERVSQGVARERSLTEVDVAQLKFCPTIDAGHHVVVA
jgi:YcaO-like protein with predicted kinase domain